MDQLYVCDPLGFSPLLTDAERSVLGRLREVLDAKVHPLLAEYSENGEFPDQVWPDLIELDLMDPPEIAAGAASSALYAGFRTFELARTDASIATMYNAESGLFRTAITLGADPALAPELDPKIRRFELTGVFALTEPDHGSDIAGGLATTARRDGEHWVLDGAKRWIGGADGADVLAVFARAGSSGTRTPRWSSRPPAGSCGRPSRWPARWPVATASPWPPTSPGSTPTPRPSTPTRAPTRSTPSSSAARSPASAPSPVDRTLVRQIRIGDHHDPRQCRRDAAR